MSEQFDFDKALAALQNGQDLTGKDGILTPLVKQLTEAALKAEAESHLGRMKHRTARTVIPGKPSNLPRAVSSWRHPGIERALLSPS